MTNENALMAVPMHKCGTDLILKAVPIIKDGQEFERNVHYCVMCRKYVYGPPSESFETQDPKEMGDYISNQIRLGKALWDF
jgi:hypothetical protein